MDYNQNEAIIDDNLKSDNNIKDTKDANNSQYKTKDKILNHQKHILIYLLYQILIQQVI